MPNIALYKTTNQGEFRVVKKNYFNTVYYEIQKKFMFLWSIPIWNTLNDGDFDAPFTYKWKSMNEVNEFFKTGKIRRPGTCIP